jgi:diadenosine tetraphosphate (Ap4A) HIT family hydrolase
MHKRPIIIVTPTKHVNSISDLSSEELSNIFTAINEFCKFWHLDDCHISYSTGKWKTNDHFHIKIKALDQIINRLRRDHFMKIRLENIYNEN